MHHSTPPVFGMQLCLTVSDRQLPDGPGSAGGKAGMATTAAVRWRCATAGTISEWLTAALRGAGTLCLGSCLSQRSRPAGRSGPGRLTACQNLLRLAKHKQWLPIQMASFHVNERTSKGSLDFRFLGEFSSDCADKGCLPGEKRGLQTPQLSQQEPLRPVPGRGCCC